MYRVSDWYTSLACFTFPTVFIHLSPEEIETVATGTTNGPDVTRIQERISRALPHIRGSAFIHADVCTPTDSATFKEHKGAIRSGERGWTMLVESDKVKGAFAEGLTERICLHSYRRMEPIREFRAFVRNRKIVAMSQMKLNRHYGRLNGRREEIWTKGQRLIAEIANELPADDLVIDLYLTSAGDYMIIDMNLWGEPTDPLLLRTWDRDWSEELGLKLIEKPTKLGGEVQVSF
jgi:hypothetical protein